MAKKQVVSEEESRQYVPEPDKRDLFTERMNKKGYKVDNSKCVDKDMMTFVARYLLKEPVTDSDRTFYCNGLLAKFEQVPEITTDLKFDNKIDGN